MPTDAKDAARQISSLNETSKACLGGKQEPPSEDGSRDRIQPVILRWISGAYMYHQRIILTDGYRKPTLEHIQHPLGNDESTSNIDTG